MALVPTADPNVYLTVEARPGSGYDAILPVSGVVVHELDTGAPCTLGGAPFPTCWGQLRRQQPAVSAIDNASHVIGVGEELTVHGVTIGVPQSTGTGFRVTFDGRPFRTYYASTCGGHTTEPETSGLDPGKAREPLRGVACGHCTTSKYYSWTKTLTDAEALAGFKRRKRAVAAPVREIRIAKRGRGGWVAEAAVRHGPKGAVHVLPGHELRSSLGLRSNRIESITRTAGGWTVKGRGWGHGVGMCQWGAIEMGRKGASETEILRYYYPGITFTKVY